MYTWTAPVSPQYLSCCSLSWMRGEATLSATLEASNNEHQDIILTKIKQYTKLKRITGRRNLRCNHKLSDAYGLESVVQHTVQATLSETLKHDWCKLAFMSIFVFNYERISNFPHSKPIKISLKCMNETKKKKRLQKVFTLHYWRFFFDSSICFSLFCFTMICLSSRLRGTGTSGRIQGREWKNQDPVIYVRRLYMNWHVHIQPRFLFLLKRRLLNQLFWRALPLALSNPSWFRSASSCIQKKRGRGGEKTRKKLKRRRERMSVSPHQTGRLECRWEVWEGPVMLSSFAFRHLVVIQVQRGVDAGLQGQKWTETTQEIVIVPLTDASLKRLWKRASPRRFKTWYQMQDEPMICAT